MTGSGVAIAFTVFMVFLMVGVPIIWVSRRGKPKLLCHLAPYTGFHSIEACQDATGAWHEPIRFGYVDTSFQRDGVKPGYVRVEYVSQGRTIRADLPGGLRVRRNGMNNAPKPNPLDPHRW